MPCQPRWLARWILNPIASVEGVRRIVWYGYSREPVENGPVNRDGGVGDFQPGDTLDYIEGIGISITDRRHHGFLQDIS
jgi:hypothetical protein